MDGKNYSTELWICGGCNRSDLDFSYHLLSCLGEKEIFIDVHQAKAVGRQPFEQSPGSQTKSPGFRNIFWFVESALQIKRTLVLLKGSLDPWNFLKKSNFHDPIVQSFGGPRLCMAKALEKDGVFMHGLCHQKPRPQRATSKNRDFLVTTKSGLKMSWKKNSLKKDGILVVICIPEDRPYTCNAVFSTKNGCTIPHHVVIAVACFMETHPILPDVASTKTVVCSKLVSVARTSSNIFCKNLEPSLF